MTVVRIFTLVGVDTNSMPSYRDGPKSPPRLYPSPRTPPVSPTRVPIQRAILTVSIFLYFCARSLPPSLPQSYPTNALFSFLIDQLPDRTTAKCRIIHNLPGRVPKSVLRVRAKSRGRGGVGVLSLYEWFRDGQQWFVIQVVADA